MKLPIACALLAMAAATTASPYTLSPPDTSARLKGIMTFTPNEGVNQSPFQCKIILDLKTKTPKITGYRFPIGCSGGATIPGLPFYIGLINENSGAMGFSSFSSGFGNCIADQVNFNVDSQGKWTFTGPCLSGTLKSVPAVTIVP